jgi:manganese-dependent ADP-ribose/CDP-alcohol diphosphatase
MDEQETAADRRYPMVDSQITRRDFVRILASSAVIAAAADQGNADASQEDQAAFAFGVIADAQYCDAEPSGTRYYRASRKKLTECADSLNPMNLAFTIQLGDLIDRDARSYETILPIFNRIQSPRYHVLGNHDFSVAADKIEEVPALLGMRERYYQFHSHGWRFVVLDGNDLSLVARPQGSPEYEQAQSLYATLKEKNAPNAQTWNGGVGESQLAWLDRQLSEADETGQRAIIFCHFPVYPENAHNLWNDRDVVQILDSRRCVVAYLNGHNHAGNYGQQRGIHYVTLPGMVETQDTTAYAAVHVHADCLRVVGQGRTPQRVLRYRE